MSTWKRVNNGGVSSINSLLSKSASWIQGMEALCLSSGVSLKVTLPYFLLNKEHISICDQMTPPNTFITRTMSPGTGNLDHVPELTDTMGFSD
jgi:hypothetical protein